MNIKIDRLEDKNDNPLILFDGLCGFCSASVQWLIRRDKRAVFRFAAIQSKIGRHHYKKWGLDPENITSFVLMQDNQAYFKSDATLKIAKTLGGLWRLLMFFYLMPRPIRNFLYDLIAKNRLRLMGRHKSCLRPCKTIRERFLE